MTVSSKKYRPAKKPSYTNVNPTISSLNISNKHDLTTKDITGYRLMYPGSHIQRSCLSTESAKAGQQPHVTEVPLGKFLGKFEIL